jgi:uncharacterized membrane protein
MTTARPQKKIICQICHQAKEPGEVMPAELVREAVAETIRKSYPGWSREGYICLPDLNNFRARYVEEVLEDEQGRISALKQQVARGLQEHELLSRNINLEYERDLTYGQRVADKVTGFGGSWPFIFSYLTIVVIWVVINSAALLIHPFDPYPYIFLNLILSGVAGIQAPIILMSQNRQDAKDRIRAENDYRLNLQAELEVRHLNDKIDMLLTTQWQHLLEIQHIQTTIMEELAALCPPDKEAPGK